MGHTEKKKIWTAILLIPPLISLIVWGPSVVFTLMVLLTIFLGLREFYSLTLPDTLWIERAAGIGLGMILALLVSWGKVDLVPPWVALVLLLLSILFMMTSKTLSSTVSRMGITLFGMFYIGFLLSYIVLIRNRTDGVQWVLFLILTIWAGDIFAFMGGSLFGRHKLYPKISPNKTFEGLVGAIVGSVVVAFPFALIFLPGEYLGTSVLLAVGLGFLGQMGDFTESMLKRGAQVKDSGSLIPGHGGILDRIDSFLFAAPFFHYVLVYVLKETP